MSEHSSWSKPYPFDENDEDYTLNHEVLFLENYVYDRDKPGSREIVEALSVIDDCLRNLLRTLLPPNRLDDIFGRYALDGMTVRYAVKYCQLLLENLSSAKILLSEALDGIDTSQEVIKPNLEAPFLKVWRDGQKRQEAQEAQRQARSDLALAQRAAHAGSEIRNTKRKRGKNRR